MRHVLTGFIAAFASAACATAPEAARPAPPIIAAPPVAAVPVTPAVPAPLAAPAVSAPPTAPRFDTAIAAFETQDRTDMPPACATLFVGSSTIRFWDTLKVDFPTRTVVNRGFGGSTIWEVDAYFDRVVAPYHPGAIVFYAGDNDLSLDRRTPDQVYADFVYFMYLKDKALGTTPVWFISVKPSKLRWALQDKMTEVNARVKALADARDDLAFVDTVSVMLNADGLPKDIFRADNLHMTAEGYALWAPIVNQSLDAGQPARAPGC